MIPESYRTAETIQVPFGILLVQEAKKSLGAKSVRWRGVPNARLLGMDEKTGYDCSGLVIAKAKKLGFPVSDDIRYVHEIFGSDAWGEQVSYEDRQAGDLAWYRTEEKKDRPRDHIVIMTSKDTYIHAPGEDGTYVCEARLEYEEGPVVYEGIPRIVGLNGRYLRQFKRLPLVSFSYLSRSIQV